MSRPSLYHLALAGEWEEAVGRGGPYERSTVGRSLAEEGFVHCSFDHQVGVTAERFYAGHDDVVVLRIDPARVGSEVVVEDVGGAGERYPHLYGPLPLDAVVEVTPLGRWRRPPHD